MSEKVDEIVDEILVGVFGHTNADRRRVLGVFAERLASAEETASLVGVAWTDLQQRALRAEAERDDQSNELAQIVTWTDAYEPNQTYLSCDIAEMVATTVTKLRRERDEARAECESLRAAGKVLVAAETRAFDAARAAHEEIERLREPTPPDLSQRVERLEVRQGLLVNAVRDLITATHVHSNGRPVNFTSHSFDALHSIATREKGEG